VASFAVWRDDSGNSVGVCGDAAAPACNVAEQKAANACGGGGAR